ncbi:hypothetical protein HMPREF1502_0645 [Klebsiella sp. AS10]|nr:hypothetical protein A225_5199 [Klebsiella michiganensis E718]AWF50043.1 hypothetical protein CSC12_3080 [Klebsiella michiganensis]EUB41024.1 hypothetical protein HMPREF1502_0645 [Klebsiella sp. AS10]
MTHSELQGKIRIKLKIAAGLGMTFRVGFLLLRPCSSLDRLRSGVVCSMKE